MCGELWQADAMHGPMLMNPATGRTQRAIIFGLIDDRSRLIPYLEAGFGETEQRFLTVLYNAMARRGIVRGLLRDNHASFSGFDLRFLCARLSIHLVHSRPGDAPSKGKIERFWRTLRAQLVERLDLERVTSIDELSKAIADGKLDGIKGLGEKKIEAIKQGIAMRAQALVRVGIGSLQHV